MESPLDKFDGIDKTDVQRDDDVDEQREQLELQISNKRGLKKDHKKINKLGEEKMEEEKTRKKLVERIRDLFDEYSNKMDKSLNGSTQGDNNDEIVLEENDPLADWDIHLSVHRRQSTNELDKYLEEETFSRRDDFNILQWWSLYSSKYSMLPQIACDLFVLLVFMVSSDSAFSTGERVISDHRNRLSSETVKGLICLQDWLRADGELKLKLVDLNV